MTYTRDSIEWLIPGIWDSRRIMEGPGLSDGPPQDMPKAQADPRRTLNRVLGLADVQSAYKKAGLSTREKRCLLLRHGMDLTALETSIILNISYDDAYNAWNRAVLKLMRQLGAKSVDEIDPADVDW